MKKHKLTALLLSSLFTFSFAGCSLVIEDAPTGTPGLPAISQSPAATQNPGTTQEPIGTLSDTSPTGFSFGYNSNEFIYRLTSYIGSDNTDNEKAFNNLKIDTDEFITTTLENGMISTSGIHEIDGEPAFSFVLNADKEGNVFDIALIMYPSFMRKITNNGNALYPYLVTYTVCAALECDAEKATSIIQDLLDEKNRSSTGIFNFESENIFYHFFNTTDSSSFSISIGDEGLFFESIQSTQQ